MVDSFGLYNYNSNIINTKFWDTEKQVTRVTIETYLRWTKTNTNRADGKWYHRWMNGTDRNRS